MLFFLHHCELPSLEPRVNRAPVDFRIQLAPRLPPAVPQREHVLQPPVEVPQNEAPVEQTSSETSALNVEEQNEESLQRTELCRIRPGHSNTVLTETSIEPTQQGDQSGQSQQLLTEEELRKARLQHFERKGD